MAHRPRPHVMFVMYRWIPGTNKTECNYERNFVGTLEASGLATSSAVHLDELFDQNGRPGDDVLLERCEQERPDLVFFVPMWQGRFNPTVETLQAIRTRLGIPVVAVWGDMHVPALRAFAESLDSVIDLHVGTGSSAVIARIATPSKFLYSWYPADPRLFFDPGRPRDIDFSFTGSRDRPERKAVFDHIERAGLPLHTSGGQLLQKPLTMQEYAETFQRSKVALSFCRSGNAMYVMNARPFELALCGALMVEERSIETPKLLSPFEHYVPYTSPADLVAKVRHYLAHDDERAAIAARGRDRVTKLYSAQRFWSLVLERAAESRTTKLARRSIFLSQDPQDFVSRIGGSDVPGLGLPTRVALTIEDRVYTNERAFRAYYDWNTWVTHVKHLHRQGGASFVAGRALVFPAKAAQRALSPALKRVGIDVDFTQRGEWKLEKSPGYRLGRALSAPWRWLSNARRRRA